MKVSSNLFSLQKESSFQRPIVQVIPAPSNNIAKVQEDGSLRKWVDTSCFFQTNPTSDGGLSHWDKVMMHQLSSQGSVLCNVIFGGTHNQGGSLIQDTIEGGYILCGILRSNTVTHSYYQAKKDSGKGLLALPMKYRYGYFLRGLQVASIMNGQMIVNMIRLKLTASGKGVSACVWRLLHCKDQNPKAVKDQVVFILELQLAMDREAISGQNNRKQVEWMKTLGRSRFRKVFVIYRVVTGDYIITEHTNVKRFKILL